jgi:hypothetical protein
MAWKGDQMDEQTSQAECEELTIEELTIEELNEFAGGDCVSTIACGTTASTPLFCFWCFSTYDCA